MDWIKQYVDDVVLLNLEHRVDRYDLSTKELSRVGITDVRHFKAVQHDIGIIGCTRSHYEIIKHAKAAGHKSILIFEDDIELHEHAEVFQHVVESAFETIHMNNLQPHMLYLGGNATHQHDGHDASMPYHERISDHLYRLGGSKTTHAYIVFESLYDLIISTYESIQWHPNEFRGDSRMNIDFWYLSRLHHHPDKFNIYGVYPALAGQRESYSDIMGRVMYFDLFEKYNKMLETNGIG